MFSVDVRPAMHFLAWYAPESPTMTPIDPDWALPIAARATSDQLESSVHLLWLTQETSEKNTPIGYKAHIS